MGVIPFPFFVYEIGHRKKAPMPDLIFSEKYLPGIFETVNRPAAKGVFRNNSRLLFLTIQIITY